MSARNTLKAKAARRAARTARHSYWPPRQQGHCIGRFLALIFTGGF